MLILITKDGATKVSKECSPEEAAGYISTGFVVEMQGDDGGWVPFAMPGAVEAQPPQDDAFVEVGATRFSDGKKQTKASLAAAQKAWDAAHPVD